MNISTILDDGIAAQGNPRKKKLNRTNLNIDAIDTVIAVVTVMSNDRQNCPSFLDPTVKGGATRRYLAEAVFADAASSHSSKSTGCSSVPFFSCASLGQGREHGEL
jgi:hypothetical protein